MTWLHPSCKWLTRGSDSCEQLDDFVTESRKVAGFSLSVSGMHPRGHWAFLTILVGFPLIISIGSDSFSAKHVHPCFLPGSVRSEGEGDNRGDNG